MRIPGLNHLKLRLWTALQTDPSEGIRLSGFWNVVAEVAPDLGALANKIGWPYEELAVLEAYRGSPDRYYFASVREIRHVFCGEPGGFEFVSTSTPGYRLGERCPSVVLRRTHPSKKFAVSLQSG